MATKIRLQRGGRKGYAFYSVVIADSRAPRDGRFIEKLGTYNPNTNPATVDINFERALYWVECGAQPTDTVRNILSKEGVYLMKHLKGGVKKGAFDEAAVQQKFDAWKQAKVNGIDAAKAAIAKAKEAAKATQLAAEKAQNEAKAKAVAEKKAAAVAAQAEAAAEETETTEAAEA
ncbi:30S ribosomal protein S16 [Prevotella sp. PINT]|jgi:ribosomal protein S16|uniref:30S ribosomal protein S16 n=1 Tax=Palleniella intestinalis TaxID=2736291 RepID=UPI0015544539|nr:30S ribosomal protein S16 [Palleniella intestinalis]NPD80436.1 30S ribosomal protein S16 [Palleniella intestinalis]